MSEPASALNRAIYEGIARVEERGLQGMITLRGDLSDKTLRRGAEAAGGVDMPGQRLAIVSEDAGAHRGLCWMSPDEVLILCPFDGVAARVQALTATLGTVHSLAVNVSDARAVFCVSGPCAREVLAKLCPVDMSPGVFKPGMFRRTRMAQVAAAFWMDGEENIHIICFRSVAEYVFELLKTAAQPGAEVGYY